MKLLQKARKYEAEEAEKIASEERPAFHLTPRVGWMNDPNGFCLYQGKYHLFFQYYPYSCIWGPMHWGHALSSDLIHWEALPAALAPDSKNDKGGCFSGCGIETEDGSLALVYTGVKKIKNKNIQIQCLALGDGRDFKKEKAPVIDSPQLPANACIEDFRDPKVIKSEDGNYYLYAVNKNKEGKGQVLLYKSRNLTDWDFISCLLENDFGLGNMWECPDIFELDGQSVLMMSAQQVIQSEDFDSGNIGVCILGRYDKTCHKFIKGKVFQLDRGLDFYAQQTVKSPDGRRIMIGWLQNWDICNYREKDSKWFGQMSIPREITIKDGILLQKPVREIENYRQKKEEIKALKMKDEKCSIPQLKSDKLDMTISVKKCDSDLSYFNINLFEAEGHCARIYYDYKLAKAGIDRSRAGVSAALLHERACTYKPQEGEELKLRIITDRNSVEVFWGQGELAMSMSIYDEAKGTGLSFEVLGAAEINASCYELKNAEKALK